jgi:hypothetical protein
MTHLWMLLFDVFVVGGIAIMGAVLFLWKYRAQHSDRRSPLTRRLLRSPGESLRARVEDAQWDIATYLAAGMLPMPLALGLYFASWVGGEGAPTAGLSTALAVCALVAQSWFVAKLWRALARLRRLRLGHEAEVAIGQELAELGRSGFRIFHDFPASDGSFNIDHVLVGPSGVYAIETKGRSRPGRRNAADATGEVEYDGKALQFPGWVETRPLAQAQRNADWLQKWLSSAVGQAIAVQPILALPGWFVLRMGAEGIPVLAAGQIQSYFGSRSAHAAMSPQLIGQIVRQLDQKCRDSSLPAAHRPGARGEREGAVVASR